MIGENLYPEAGRFAQPEIQAAIERFRRLPAEERARTPLLWWLTGGESTQGYKMSKADALYTDRSQSPEQVCCNCRFFYYSNAFKIYICSQVQGTVACAGWCRLWKHERTGE